METPRNNDNYGVTGKKNRSEIFKAEIQNTVAKLPDSEQCFSPQGDICKSPLPSSYYERCAASWASVIGTVALSGNGRVSAPFLPIQHTWSQADILPRTNMINIKNS